MPTSVHFLNLLCILYPYLVFSQIFPGRIPAIYGVYFGSYCTCLIVLLVTWLLLHVGSAKGFPLYSLSLPVVVWLNRPVIPGGDWKVVFPACLGISVPLAEDVPALSPEVSLKL